LAIVAQLSRWVVSSCGRPSTGQRPTMSCGSWPFLSCSHRSAGGRITWTNNPLSVNYDQWCERQKLTYVKFWRNVIRNVNFCNFFTFTLTWRICYFLLTFYVYVWRKLKFSCLFEHVIFQFCEKFWRVWKIVCFTRFYSFFLQ
jgi:hypothetical protein